MYRFIVMSLLFTLTGSVNSINSQINYPSSKKEKVSDNYHGSIVQDPYRWLENDTSAETANWVEAQNKLTRSVLSQITFRDKIRDKINELLNYPRYSAPSKVGEYYIFSKNDGLQNQSIIFKQKGLDAAPEVLIDPNTMSDNGTVSVSITGYSNDHKYMTYAVSSAGSDWSEMKIMEVASGKTLVDVLKYVKFSGSAWVDDGFYYSRYPEPAKGMELSAQNQFHSVYFHKIGDTQDKDRLIYVDKKNPLRYHFAYATEDENFLLLSISEGTDGNETWYRNLKKGDTSFKPLLYGFDHSSSVVANDGDDLLVLTNVDAPNYRLVRINPEMPDKANWKDVIPEASNLLKSVSAAGMKLFAEYLDNVNTKVIRYSYIGNLEQEITLPALGSAGGFDGENDAKEVFYTFNSFNYAPTIFRYDIASGKSIEFRKSEVKFNPDDFVVKQEFASSKDGTKVPMFIVHKKGIKLDGSNPTLLYAYGGFNVSLEPSFSASRIPFLEYGGVFVLANLRGGGEYGENWHKAGMMYKKQNVFDDFIACAEYLQTQKYTSKEKLAIQGGSNGGLLVGAVMTQRPDLFQVCIPQVGVMDMLRFQKFTVGWGWVDEYGSSDDPNMFPFLLGYSPLHNIMKTEYPATMVMTADHDDRVVPAHSFKFIATLQANQQGKQPVLIRIETNAGHGAGTSLNKSVEQIADIYAFIFHMTNTTIN
ncbi:MAG: prolyl oligopeptidase family serine peptidase [Bacteroidia bacterium]